MGPSLSLVVPAYNEASRIESGFSRLAPVLDQIGRDAVEVIVIDDGSSDQTGLVAATIYGQLPHSLVIRREFNAGKGAAFRLGVAAARSPHVILCDADMAIDPSHIPAVTRALADSPLAIGSRTVGDKIHYTSRVRTSSGAIFNSIVRREIGTDVRDTQCGFKGFQLGAARLLACFGWVDGFAFDAELLFLSSRLGLAVATVPVTWDDVSGSSVNILSDSRKMLRDIRRIPRHSYEAVVVRIPGRADADAIRDVALSARLQGLVIAHGPVDSIVVLPRDGAVAGVEIAATTKGAIGVATLGDVAGRDLEAL